MNNKLLKYLMAGVLGTTLAIASPALAFHGGGGGMGGGAHFGGGGMHFGGMGGAAHFGAMGGGPHFGAMGGGPHFNAMGGGPQFGGMHFNGGRFAATPFAHAGFSPRFSRFAFRDQGHFFHHRFFHHRFNRFAFVGAPFIYADYYYDDGCWRRVWTPYGWNWTNVCVGYGYY